ncbi:iron(III) transport system ATP-binding protein [Paracoccus halophilus]|uniref:Iron(III) transport system ATP-binding protein n=1 Tax=Paracoccus halophilus TaxID=376733 RepID=A0A1I0TB69_9RHOB|nr:ABC transporter ATP-binding protein [Paracoccus halophilus]SFA48960.1 iron(III) transport system ATP-binding protein [Paracoccus halophilus]
MTSISFDNVSRSFGQTRAVDDVTATFESGRFVALLGPSGCGKTTLLRLIAGLERLDSGAIRLDDRTVAAPGRFVPPEARGLGMVFQSYALWPHMTVAGNIAFGLNRLSRAERDSRVTESLRMTGLTQMAGRKPHELSGGQRQRVALARSLSARPRILLLDEPLANLDAHLRQSMLAEFRRIHAATGCTMVFVTHDQNEAMAVADTVGVMDRGRLQQLAAPQHLFDRPASPMVARFVGQGRTLPVTAEGLDADGRAGIRIGGHRIAVPGKVAQGPAWLCLHARDLSLAAEGVPARVASTRFEDGYHVADVILDALPEAVPVSVRLDAPARQGDAIRLAIRGGWLLPREDDEGVAPGSRNASHAPRARDGLPA